MASRERWTAEQISTLQAMHGKASLREIASAVRKPIGSVSTKVMRLGLAERKPPWTEQEEALLREMVEQSRTDEEIAHALGRPKTAVRRKRFRLGLVRWRQQPRHDEAARLAAVLEDVVVLLRSKAPHREILETIYEGWSGARTA